MNPSCISFFNLKSHEVRTRLLLKMTHPEDQRYVLTKLKACTDGESVADVECRVIRGTAERWLRVTPFLAEEDGERLLIGQAEDITAYRSHVETLNNHNIKKNSILNILSHDLMGPIGAIGNLSTLLARETERLNIPSIDRSIKMIDKITQSSIKLIRDFIDQEFLETSAVHLMKKRVELINKIKLTTEDYFNMQKDLKIEFLCDSNKERIFVEIDEDKFMQVINNLVSNSLKFTPPGGKIDIYVKENKKDIVISIRDNGIGIPKKYHDILFDKFSVARRSGLKGERSTGLGMSIIKTIVEWHGGNIWFESEEGFGTTFFIQLPKK